MKTTIRRTFTFEAAHRLLNHTGKCRHLHGHSYKATIEIEGIVDQIRGNGMLLDFSVVKDTIGKWIDSHLDHNIILNPGDPLLQLGRIMVRQNIWADKDAWNNGKMPYVMPTDMPEPTAENISRLLFRTTSDLISEYLHSLPPEIKPDLNHPVVPVSVTVQETEKCEATFTL